MIDKTLPHADIINHVKERTPDGHVLLSFSGGKDAWATWLSIREHFAPDKITPFYYYLVPGLEFINDYLDYAETVIGTHITRLPSPRFYEMLNNYVYQPPDRWPTIQLLGLPKYTWDDVHRACETSRGLPENCWCAMGLRSADSIQRATALRTHGVVNDKRRTFYPVWDWKIDQVYTSLRGENIKLPVDYKLFGRTFDGIYLLYLYNIKKHYPRDYATILEWFPLADMEIWRYEKYGHKA